MGHRMLAKSPADFGSLCLHACGVPGGPRIGPGVISTLPRGAPPGYPRRHIVVSPVYPGVLYRAGVEWQNVEASVGHFKAECCAI